MSGRQWVNSVLQLTVPLFAVNAYVMILLGSHFIVLATTLFPITLIITYTLSVYSNHVYPFWPFMSYTGDIPIESCIFSFGVNISAALLFIIVFLRYNQIMKAFEEERTLEADVINRKNLSALEWGLTSTFGLSMTASFQQCNAYSTHLVGAGLCSYCGFAYICYQTVLSRKLVGREHGMGMVYFRAAICLSNAAFLLSAPLLLLYLDLIYSRSHAETVCWSQSEEGWYIHLCSSVVEWLLFCTNEAYIISFYSEFKRIRIERDEIFFNDGSENK